MLHNNNMCIYLFMLKLAYHLLIIISDDQFQISSISLVSFFNTKLSICLVIFFNTKLSFCCFFIIFTQSKLSFYVDIYKTINWILSGYLNCKPYKICIFFPCPIDGFPYSVGFVGSNPLCLPCVRPLLR